MDLIRSCGKPLFPKEAASLLDRPYENVKQLMWKMEKAGALTSKDGKYDIFDLREHVNSAHSISIPLTKIT